MGHNLSPLYTHIFSTLWESNSLKEKKNITIWISNIVKCNMKMMAFIGNSYTLKGSPIHSSFLFLPFFLPTLSIAFKLMLKGKWGKKKIGGKAPSYLENLFSSGVVFVGLLNWQVYYQYPKDKTFFFVFGPWIIFFLIQHR